MSDAIISTILSAVVTLAVCCITNYAQNKKTIALIEYKLTELTKQVEKHNSVVTRTYELERSTSVLEEKISVANNRIKDLESKVG